MLILIVIVMYIGFPQKLDKTDKIFFILRQGLQKVEVCFMYYFLHCKLLRRIFQGWWTAAIKKGTPNYITYYSSFTGLDREKATCPIYMKVFLTLALA